MYNKKNFFNKLKKANKIVSDNKSSAQKKRSETLEKYKSIADMQAFIDKSEEKRNILIEVVETALDEESGKKIIEKGVVVYVKLLEVVELIEEDFTKNNIEFKTITGKVTAGRRIKIVDWFNENPMNKVLLISDAGGESLDIRSSDQLILYSIPDGYRKFTQTIGRVSRGFFNKVDIRLIQVESSIDEFLGVLISSKKELEMELLGCDSIKLNTVSSFNSDILRSIRKKLLWKL